MKPNKPVLLPLTNGMFAKVSRRDYDRVAAYRWAMQTDIKHRPHVRQQLPYSAEQRTRQGQYGAYLHRFILDLTDSSISVRFQDNDKLNCTRENMYVVKRQNLTPVPKRSGPTERPDSAEIPRELPSPCGGIVKAKEGRRCKAYSKTGWEIPDGCQHYSRCLDACCKAWWPGFVAAKDLSNASH